MIEAAMAEPKAGPSKQAAPEPAPAARPSPSLQRADSMMFDSDDDALFAEINLECYGDTT